MGSEDSARAGLSWEVVQLWERPVVTCDTLVSQANTWLSTLCWITNGHAETLCGLERDMQRYGEAKYRWEGLDLLLAEIVPVQIELCIIHSNAALSAL